MARKGTPSPTVNPMTNLSRCERPSPWLPSPCSLPVILGDVDLGGTYDAGTPLVGAIETIFDPNGISLVTNACVLAGYVAEEPDGTVRIEVNVCFIEVVFCRFIGQLTYPVDTQLTMV